jgi:sugar/nucleoside kinase (ribokinase family)
VIYDVIVLGDYCLDLIFTGLDEFPKLGTEIEAKALAMETGGPCNSALALHRLGVKTAWACEFGTDEYSQFVLERLRTEKFPEDLFIFSPGRVRKITVSLSYPDDRAFIAYYDKGKMIETAIKGILAKSTKILLIPALVYGPATSIASIISKLKNSVIYMDGNSSGTATLADPEVRKTLQAVRFYAPNRKEAHALTGIDDPRKAVLELGKICQTVIVKDGQNGSWCCNNNQIYYEPSYPVKVVDTTGAGDCFNAGFIRAWLDGKDIQTCLRWGNVAGALSTQKAGGNGYRLSFGEIESIVSRKKK